MKERDPISDYIENDTSQSIVEDLTTLQSEFAQLSELGEMERNYTRKLVDALKLLQSDVDMALPLPVECLGPSYATAKEAFLAPECIVMLTDSEDKKRCMALEKFESKYVLSVVKEATPALAKIISDRRKDVGARVDLLERILKEVKKAGNMAKVSSERAPSRPSDDDLVQNSITTE